MTALELVRSKKAEILDIAERYGFRNLSVFGSAARGEERPDSDIDIMYDATAQVGLMDIGGFSYELGELLGVTVDAGPRELLIPAARATAERDAVRIA